MKERLRKKLRLREFREMGFSVKYDLEAAMTDDGLSSFWVKLIDMVEANHLMIGGGINDFFVATDSRRSATEADRAVIQNWLQQQPEVSSIVIGPLVDAWHGTFKD